MKSFEEQFVHEFYMGKNNKGEYIDDRTRMASFCYEAGQQSKQAKVDELQKRIDVLSKKLNEMAHIFLDDLDDILKGNSHES